MNTNAFDHTKTRANIIIEMMPFSQPLKDWAKTHRDFFNGLKVIYPDRFITLQAIATSYSPFYPNDEIIGVYAYDRKSKDIMFKQDFIVNIGKLDKEYILYTRLPNRKYGKYVKDINDFFSKYSRGQFYIDSHHVKYDQLPDKIKERAIRAVQLAKNLDITGLRNFTDDELNDFYNVVKEIVPKEHLE